MSGEVSRLALRDRDAELGSVTVLLDSLGTGEQVVDADVSVLLGADDRVQSSDDLVFYNQPIGLGGALHLRDRIRLDAGEETSAVNLKIKRSDGRRRSGHVGSARGLQ